MTSHDEAMRVVPYDEASRLLQTAYIAGTKGAGYNDAAEKLYEASEAARAQAASGEPSNAMKDAIKATLEDAEKSVAILSTILKTVNLNGGYEVADAVLSDIKYALSALPIIFNQPPAPSVSVEALESLALNFEKYSRLIEISSYEHAAYMQCAEELRAIIAASKKV